MTKLKVGVIGAAGFIGNHLTLRLQKEKDIELYTMGRGAANRHPSLPYRRVDLTDRTRMQDVFSDTSIIYYLASESIPASSWENPHLEIERNLTPFLNFIESAAAARVKRIVFLSSAGTIYGPSDKKISEDQDKRPFSPYGIVKLCMEHFLSYAEARYGIKHDVYRVANAYGEGQDTSKGLGLINTMIERITEGKEIDIYGAGDVRRNYIYIRDVAELLTLSIRNGDRDSEIFNLASNDTLTINEVVAAIKLVAKEDVKIRRLPARKSDNPMIDLDNTRILRHFPGFSFTSLQNGISNTYHHIKSLQKSVTDKK